MPISGVLRSKVPVFGHPVHIVSISDHTSMASTFSLPRFHLVPLGVTVTSTAATHKQAGVPLCALKHPRQFFYLVAST